MSGPLCRRSTSPRCEAPRFIINVGNRSVQGSQGISVSPSVWLALVLSFSRIQAARTVVVCSEMRSGAAPCPASVWVKIGRLHHHGEWQSRPVASTQSITNELEARPNGVSSRNALWQVVHGCPVWRAQRGSDTARGDRTARRNLVFGQYDSLNGCLFYPQLDWRLEIRGDLDFFLKSL